MNDSSVLPRRRELREGAIRAREALPSDVRETLTAQLAAHLERLLEEVRPAVLGFCWPHRCEPDLRPLVTRWVKADRSRLAALPVVLDKEKALTFRRWTPGMELLPDRHGIPHPPSGSALTPDVLLVPLNAFDAAGYRLGYGGGYFDRTLAAMSARAIGFGFEIGRTETVFPQSHDRPMDWVVTESGVFVPGAAQPRNM